MCIRYGHEKASDLSEADSQGESKSSGRKMRAMKTSILRGWYTRTYAEIANIKRGHIVKFDDIIAELGRGFAVSKDLAELRVVLFPIRGSLFTRTSKDHSNVRRDGYCI